MTPSPIDSTRDLQYRCMLRTLLPEGSSTTSCRAVMFLWRRVRMMATSRFRSSMGLRFLRAPAACRPPLCASSSPFFTICAHRRVSDCTVGHARSWADV